MKSLGIFQINKTKRLFLLYGILNFLITNIVLQVLLLLISTFFATIISQIINVSIGYFFYGKKVFKLNNLNTIIFKKYVFLASILWILNFSFIQLFFQFGVNKNLIAIFMIPLLVIISYLCQKNYVFKRNFP